MTSGADLDANHATAARLVREAAAQGADIVVLPETWNLMPGASAARAGAEDLDGPSVRLAQGWARELRMTVVAGSIGERIAGAERIYNTSVAITPDGRIAGVYRKLHLFDVDVAGRGYRESATVAPGMEIQVVDVGPLHVGMSVCYDLRFPELYRRMIDRGATVLVVPSAFTARTGRDHWEVLVRARAIENQAFVVAADQVGVHPDGSESYGHSMIVSPWGDVLAEVAGGEGIACADIDLAVLARVRTTLPALRHRRQELLDS